VRQRVRKGRDSPKTLAGGLVWVPGHFYAKPATQKGMLVILKIKGVKPTNLGSYLLKIKKDTKALSAKKR